MLERYPIEKLHRDERTTIMLADLVDSADVGMVQCGSGPSFAAKAFQCVRTLSDIVGKKLERDKAPENGVLSLVDDTHPAAAQLLDDAVMRDGLPDHWRESYVC